MQGSIPDHPAVLRIDLPEPPGGDPTDQAFLYRLNGVYLGFFNRCGHIRLPMDLEDGRFFDPEGMIICRVHGARFDENQGHCLMGPASVGLYRLILETGQRQNLEGEHANQKQVSPDFQSSRIPRQAGLSSLEFPSVQVLGWEGPVVPS